MIKIQNTKQQKGFVQIALIIFLILGIVILSAVSFYLLKSKGQEPVMNVSEVVESPAASVNPVTESNDTKSIEIDLNTTELDSFDTDLNNLDSSAGSL